MRSRIRTLVGCNGHIRCACILQPIFFLFSLLLFGTQRSAVMSKKEMRVYFHCLFVDVYIVFFTSSIYTILCVLRCSRPSIHLCTENDPAEHWTITMWCVIRQQRAHTHTGAGSRWCRHRGIFSSISPMAKNFGDFQCAPKTTTENCFCHVIKGFQWKDEKKKYKIKWKCVRRCSAVADIWEI